VCDKTSFWLHWEQLPVLDVSLPKILKLIYINQKNFRFIFILSSSARHPRAEPPAYHAIVFGIAPSDEVPNPQKKTRTKMVRVSVLQFI